MRPASRTCTTRGPVPARARACSSERSMSLVCELSSSPSSWATRMDKAKSLFARTSNGCDSTNPCHFPTRKLCPVSAKSRPIPVTTEVTAEVIASSAAAIIAATILLERRRATQCDDEETRLLFGCRARASFEEGFISRWPRAARAGRSPAAPIPAPGSHRRLAS